MTPTQAIFDRLLREAFTTYPTATSQVLSILWENNIQPEQIEPKHLLNSILEVARA